LCQFTDQGEIFIQALLTKGIGKRIQIAIEIRDTGVGISDEEMDKLFKPFTQGDVSSTRKYGGNS